MAGAASSKSGAGGATQAACGTPAWAAERPRWSVTAESGEPVGDHGHTPRDPRVGGGTPVGAVDNDTESGTGRAAG